MPRGHEPGHIYSTECIWRGSSAVVCKLRKDVIVGGQFGLDSLYMLFKTQGAVNSDA